MARPEEKANAMLNKFVKLREAGNAPKVVRSQRPRLASECTSLSDAERFRRQLVREIAERVSKIQNPGLGEHVIRDTNDEINFKMREKHHWNRRIRELGGPNYSEIELKQQLENAVGGVGGGEDVSVAGYRYYGAAKDLPGVKELLEQQTTQKQQKRQKAEIFKRLTPDYFGWREEEDGVLLELEQDVILNEERYVENDFDFFDPWEVELAPPSQESMTEALLERKKQEMLARFS
jgi:pre-mRNA-splicing factor ISY1